MELYKKEKIFEEKENTIKTLMNENKLLKEKADALETDLKVVLNNRSKLDNLEDVIVKFLQDDQEKSENVKSMMKSHNPNQNSLNNFNSTNLMTQKNPNMMSHNNPNLISPSSHQAGIQIY